MSDIELNLSEWIDRRKGYLSPGMADHIVKGVKEYEAEIARLRDALVIIDALDPESKVNGCSIYALQGLVNRMGAIARNALD